MLGTDYYKIGYTNGTVEDRVAGLQTGCPEKLEIVCVLSGDDVLEKELHRRFWEYKTSGGDEWFKIPLGVAIGGSYDSLKHPSSVIRNSPHDVRPVSGRQQYDFAGGGEDEAAAALGIGFHPDATASGQRRKPGRLHS